MTKIDHKLFTRVESVAKTVLDNLKRKGLVVPNKVGRNTFNFNGFIVGKDSAGAYYIRHPLRELNIEGINLPQTAAILANQLGLGRNTDTQILNNDRAYGFREFDKQIFQRAMIRHKNNIDQFIYYESRYKIASDQSAEHKKQITNSFEKLRSIR